MDRWTLDAIRADMEHGSAFLSYRALEILREQAATLARDEAPEAWAVLCERARALVDARPEMAVIANRIHRVMHACREDRTAEGVELEAHQVLEKAAEADDEAARRAAGYVAGRRVLTLSRSRTVLAAFAHSDPPPERIIVALSEPGREGGSVAETLAQDGRAVTLVADAAVARVCAEERVEMILVGADTVLPDGGLVNKIGTYGLMLAAHAHKIPRYAVAASEKLDPEDATPLDAIAPPFYQGTAPLDVFNPLFERTPGRLLSGIITEFGLLAPVEWRDLAAELRSLRRWNV